MSTCAFYVVQALKFSNNSVSSSYENFLINLTLIVLAPPALHRFTTVPELVGWRALSRDETIGMHEKRYAPLLAVASKPN